MRHSAILVLAAAIVAAAAFTAWWLNRDSGSVTAAPSEAETTARRTDSSTAPSDTRPIVPGKFDPSFDAGESAAADTRKEPAGVLLTAKVVGERRRPVANATIEVQVESRLAVAGKTGPDGRFRIDVGPRPESGALTGAVFAANESGRAQLKALSLDERTADVMDLGTIGLIEGGPLGVRVVRDGVPVAGARVVVSQHRYPSLGSFKSGADGTIGATRFPEGRYYVTAFLGDELRGEAQVTVPPASATSTDIALAAAWRLVVTLKDGATGQGVPGRPIEATCSIRTDDRSRTITQATTARPIAPTDADGRTVLAGLSRDRAVTVSVLSPWESDPRMRSMSRMFEQSLRATAEPGQEQVLITIGGGETFRFPIVADETEGPPDGAKVRLSVPPGYGGATPPPHGRIVGRDLVIDGVGEGTPNILSTADDGTMAIVRIIGEAKKTKVMPEAKFKKPRALAISARDTDGKPLAGYSAHVQSRGNSPLGSRIVLDGDGKGRFEGLYPQIVQVGVGRQGVDARMGKTNATCDLTPPGDGIAEIVVETARACVARVTIDGEARLPAIYELYVIGAEVGSIEEDPEGALLRFDVRPEKKGVTLKVNATARGCAPLSMDLPAFAESGATELSLAFVKAAKVRVHVLPPADNIHDVSLERWSEERARWTPAWMMMQHRSEGELGKKPMELTFDSLAGGRFRAIDMLTGVATEPIVVESGETGDLTIDLRRAGPVSGRVEGPSDKDVSAMVTVEGDGLVPVDALPGIREGKQVRINSDFQLRVPGDRAVTLRVSHSVLTPDPKAGSATVTAPGGSVVLKLVSGAVATFRVAAGEGAVQLLEPRVLLFAGKAEGTPILKCKAQVRGAVGRFGGFEPGRYTLWLDLSDGAPLVIENVELAADGTDLGTLKPPDGATLRCNVLSKPGQKPAGLSVYVSALGTPSYNRYGDGRDGVTEVIVRGLGPGRFKVEVRTGPPGAASTPSVHEVVSDGSGEIPLTVDLR